MTDSKEKALILNPSFELVPTSPPPREPSNDLRVLIVDNDRSHAEAIAEGLRGSCDKYHCTLAFSGDGGASLIEQEQFDIIITDLMMSDMNGLEILAKVKSEQPDAEVILVTGHGDVQSAVAAMHQGAFYYLLKPLDLKQLRTVTARAAENIELRKTNLDLQRRLNEKFGFEGVIGSSPSMQRLIGQLKQIAPTNATVLIQGETGTGKELVAQAIHQNSRRKNKPFVALNSAELGSTILESELFGHVKGAFTDATQDRVGKIEYAHGGTLFLDEIGDMPMSTQIKLLRVLESREITRVGSNEPIKVDVRVISATNCDLEEAIKKGEFREDLYHRIKVITVRVPPLRERTKDIPLLADLFIKQAAKEHDLKIKGRSPDLMRKLMNCPWPGNVRELKNTIEGMVVLDVDGYLDVDDLPLELQDAVPQALPAPSEDSPLQSFVGQPLSKVEEFVIRETLKFTNGNREEAAKMLGIGARSVYRKIKDYDIKT